MVNTQLQQLKDDDSDLSKSEEEDEGSHFSDFWKECLPILTIERGIRTLYQRYLQSE